MRFGKEEICQFLDVFAFIKLHRLIEQWCTNALPSSRDPYQVGGSLHWQANFVVAGGRNGFRKSAKVIGMYIETL